MPATLRKNRTPTQFYEAADFKAAPRRKQPRAITLNGVNMVLSNREMVQQNREMNGVMRELARDIRENSRIQQQRLDVHQNRLLVLERGQHGQQVAINTTYHGLRGLEEQFKGMNERMDSVEAHVMQLSHRYPDFSVDDINNQLLE